MWDQTQLITLKWSDDDGQPRRYKKQQSLTYMQIQSTHIFRYTTYSINTQNVFIFLWMHRHTNPLSHTIEWIKCANAFIHLHTHYSNSIVVNNLEKGVSGSLIQQPFREAYHHFQPLNTISGKAALLFWGKSSQCRASCLIEPSSFFFFFFFPLSNILAAGFEMPLQL